MGEGGLGQVGRGEGESDLACADLKEETVLMLVWFPPVLRTRELRRKQKQEESPVEGGSVEGMEVVVRGSVVNRLRTRELRRKQKQAESPVEGGSVEGVSCQRECSKWFEDERIETKTEARGVACRRG